MNSPSTDPARPRTVIIIGAGRSGTNWLLDIFDQSPDTHCRNEPNEIEDGAMGDLPSGILAPSPLEAEDWDRAVTTLRATMGQRDHRSLPRKTYAREPLRRAGAYRLLMRPRVRRALGIAMPTLRRGEWPVPRWLMSPARLREAPLILKLAQAPGWAQWVLDNRPDTHVVHIVRHPGGFLSSWRRRYLEGKDESIVRSENAARLARIIELQPRWSDRLGHIENMTVDESELWYWCYASQTIHDAGADHPNYTLATYEQLATEPVAEASRLYHRCGLEWNAGLERQVRSISGGSSAISTAWRTRLDQHQKELVERVLQGSDLQSLWAR